MFRNTISMMIRLGSVGTVAALAAVVGLGSSASAYETGYGPLQLVSALQSSDPPGCTGSDASATITQPYAPQYPQIALEEGLEGFSLVTFTMALDGSVSNVALAGTSGNRLFDRAAVDAVKKSRFAPATHNCSKIAGIYGIPVVFAQGSAPDWPALVPLGVGGRSPIVK